MRVEALRTLEDTLVDQALSAKHLHRLVDRARPLNFVLRREFVVMDAEQRQVVADEVEHRLDRAFAEDRKPLLFRRLDQLVAVVRGHDDRDRLQIIAWIKAFRNLADFLAERLAIPEVQRTGERVDLSARIVDIIFLRDPESRRFENAGEAVADDGAAAMPHVQRSSRVRRDIFDIDPLVIADRANAIFLAFADDGAKLVAPRVRSETKVDEAGASNFDRSDRRQRLELGFDQLCEAARVRSRGLGKNHSCVRREITMRRIARRLDRHVCG